VARERRREGPAQLVREARFWSRELGRRRYR
jgi:hypothetical protein